MTSSSSNKQLVLRLITPVSFSRIEVKDTSTFKELKDAIQRQSNVPPKEQKLFKDKDFKIPLTFGDKIIVNQIGMKCGDAIFLQNSTAQVEIGKSFVSKCSHSVNETCLNCIADKTKKEEKPKSTFEKIQEKSGLTSKCSHQPGQKCLYCMQTYVPKGELKYNCQHGEGGKCPNCVGKEFIADAKHKSFDQYINERKEKCKGTHEMSSICINCMPPSQVQYKMKPNCPDHPPYPEGSCFKCLPPNVILSRQLYRHVDYVSFMNAEEINLFLQSWIKSYFMKQKMGFLFGYYAKDPNYPDGIRAVVEAIYEPPQLGDNTSVQPTFDKDCNLVDEIASALQLECIGWIYTTLNEKGICLTSYDVRKAARYQQEYLADHSSGTTISRFITCVVKPNDLGECQIEIYMVSDMCQALERDGIFGDSRDKKQMEVRKAKKNEMLPTIYMESKPVEKFDPDFFIVNIGHGAPQNKRDMNILKSYDFPVQSRTDKGIVTESMIKDYFKRHKTTKPLVKYANFYFLLFLAKTIDKESAKVYARDMSLGIIDQEIIESLLSSYIGY